MANVAGSTGFCSTVAGACFSCCLSGGGAIVAVDVERALSSLGCLKKDEPDRAESGIRGKQRAGEQGSVSLSSLYSADSLHNTLGSHLAASWCREVTGIDTGHRGYMLSQSLALSSSSRLAEIGAAVIDRHHAANFEVLRRERTLKSAFSAPPSLCVHVPALALALALVQPPSLTRRRRCPSCPRPHHRRRSRSYPNSLFRPAAAAPTAFPSASPLPLDQPHHVFLH